MALIRAIRSRFMRNKTSDGSAINKSTTVIAANPVPASIKLAKGKALLGLALKPLATLRGKFAKVSVPFARTASAYLPLPFLAPFAPLLGAPHSRLPLSALFPLQTKPAPPAVEVNGSFTIPAARASELALTPLPTPTKTTTTPTKTNPTPITTTTTTAPAAAKTTKRTIKLRKAAGRRVKAAARGFATKARASALTVRRALAAAKGATGRRLRAVAGLPRAPQPAAIKLILTVGADDATVTVTIVPVTKSAVVPELAHVLARLGSWLDSLPRIK